MFLRWNIKRSTLIVGLVILTAIVLRLFFNEYKELQIKQAQSSPAAITNMLLKALVTNDETKLRSIVVPEHQDEVTIWLATHSPYYCIPNLFSSVASSSFWTRIKHVKVRQAVTGIMGTLSYADDLNTAHINGTYSCRNSFSYQDFRIRHLNFQSYKIVIEKRNGQWYVVRFWDSVCEIRSMGGCG